MACFFSNILYFKEFRAERANSLFPLEREKVNITTKAASLSERAVQCVRSTARNAPLENSEAGAFSREQRMERSGMIARVQGPSTVAKRSEAKARSS
jgi:hypothetical protein